jgi:hypothetical protein
MDRKELISKYGTIVAAARALGMPRQTIESRLKKKQPVNLPPAKVGRGLVEFRSTHDKSFIVPQKIKAGLQKLGEGWEYEMAFAKIAGVSLGDLSAFRSLFDEHIVIVDRTKRAWAGTKAFAEKMREMVQ